MRSQISEAQEQANAAYLLRKSIQTEFAGKLSNTLDFKEEDLDFWHDRLKKAWEREGITCKAAHSPPAGQ